MMNERWTPILPPKIQAIIAGGPKGSIYESNATDEPAFKEILFDIHGKTIRGYLIGFKGEYGYRNSLSQRIEFNRNECTILLINPDKTAAIGAVAIEFCAEQAPTEDSSQNKSLERYDYIHDPKIHMGVVPRKKQ